MKLFLISLTLLAAAVVNAQSPIGNDTKMVWGIASGNIVKAAEKMPEESYAFKPYMTCEVSPNWSATCRMPLTRSVRRRRVNRKRR